jgi:hypothetical protein
MATLLMSLVSMAALAAGIDGKWISERQVGAADGKTYSHTSSFNLKSEGAVLTGTVVQVSAAPWMAETTGQTFEIKDGKIDGDKFSFKVTSETKQGERTVVYEGTVEGDRLKGTTKYRGIGITQDFAATRAK